MKHIRRWLLRLIVALVIAGIVCVSVGAWVVRRPWAEVDGSLKVAGLTALVEVSRDHLGIPNIYAQNEHDLFFAQGYVHAQDRLWQMELSRRAGNGTLSEIFGETMLESDCVLHILGLRRAAEKQWDEM